MPEPITAAVVVKTMAKGAIAKVGAKVLEAVAPGIFSDRKKFKQIKKELAEISKKLDEVLSIARSTFQLVEQLPDIVADLIDQQTLFFAQTRIESSIQVYISLRRRPNRISHDELTDLVQSWNILVEKENKTTVINHFPRYGEYLLAATDGKVINGVLNGTRIKQKAIQDAHANIAKRIGDLAGEAESIISSPFIQSGSILNGEPWVTWNPHGPRTKRVERCITRYDPSSYNGGTWLDCRWVHVPDTAFNNELERLKRRLGDIRTLITSLSNEYRSLIVTDEILKAFLESLMKRNKSIINPKSKHKVIDGQVPFVTVD